MARVGRAGYCFHQNAAIELVLRAVGYTVERRHGHVWSQAENRYDGTLNHLVLVVSGLPTDASPDGRWWVDVGLGDAFRDPVPLVPGTFTGVDPVLGRPRRHRRTPAGRHQRRGASCPVAADPAHARRVGPSRAPLSPGAQD